MAGRIGRQPHAGPLERLPIGNLEHRPPAHADLIKPRRLRRTQRQLVACHVIAVGVRYEAARLAAAKIDRQIGRVSFSPRSK